MFVKPAPFINAEGVEDGLLRVRDPEAQDILPPDGREVPENEYWARRVRDGEVVIVTD